MSRSISDKAGAGAWASCLLCIWTPPALQSQPVACLLPACLRPQLPYGKGGTAWPEPGVVQGKLLLLLKHPLTSL